MCATEKNNIEREEVLHAPVMVDQIIANLSLRPEMIVVDATVGCGGHAGEILKRILPGGKLIGIDRDRESLNIASQVLKEFTGFNLVYGNFRNLNQILQSQNLKFVDAILFDLGVSSAQLLNPERGFSFRKEGPLDMRMDRSSCILAYDLINNLREEELSRLFWAFGQERYHRRIARFLIRARQKALITSTVQLAQVVTGAIPYCPRYRRIHPATRTFQALRIAVNRELEALEQGLKKAVDLLKQGGRIAVISFHSLEDRIVKRNFREGAASGKLKIITPKPLRPSQKERVQNPRSRSAAFRVAERL